MMKKTNKKNHIDPFKESWLKVMKRGIKSLADTTESPEYRAWYDDKENDKEKKWVDPENPKSLIYAIATVCAWVVGSVGMVLLADELTQEYFCDEEDNGIPTLKNQ